jgi:hypothetical protein
MKQGFQRNHNLVDRRCFLKRSAFGIASSFAIRTRLSASPNVETALANFTDILHELQRDPALANSMRSRAELAEAFKAGLEKAPIRSKKSATKISSRASDLIVACEVTSETAYNAHYKSLVWPGGSSGVTLGIGYDLGYATPYDLAQDWGEYLGRDNINTLSSACGATGTRARTFLGQLPAITISWEVAQRQYSDQVRPRYVGLTESTLANTASLSTDSLGALVSLVYNRGASFRLPGARYQEMRNILEHMSSKHFYRIPAEIRRMKRLWEDKPLFRGLLLRREAEADLFEVGLQS